MTGPQDEVAFWAEISNPHGEEAVKAGVSNHEGQGRSASSQPPYAIAVGWVEHL